LASYSIHFFTLKPHFMNQFETVKNMLMSMEADFVKFYDKGNSAAGTRVRKGLQDLKVKCQELRLEIQNMKNND